MRLFECQVGRVHFAEHTSAPWNLTCTGQRPKYRRCKAKSLRSEVLVAFFSKEQGAAEHFCRATPALRGLQNDVFIKKGHSKESTAQGSRAVLRMCMLFLHLVNRMAETTEQLAQISDEVLDACLTPDPK